MYQFVWLFCLFLLLCSGCDQHPRQQTVVDAHVLYAASKEDEGGQFKVLRGFEVPESFQQDPLTKKYFVSNVVGNPTEKDGNGYITRLTETRDLDIARFIIGLDAPKGIAFWNNMLLVTDVDCVRGFDPITAKKLFSQDLKAAGAQFLNDIVAAADRLYISDTFANVIFELIPDLENPAKSRVKIFSRAAQLQGPNGLAIHPQTGKLTVATWKSAEILEVDNHGTATALVAQKFKNLDGAVYDHQGNLYFSDFTAGTIYKLDTQGNLLTIAKNLTSPADIGLSLDEKTLLIPSFEGKKIITMSLEK